MKTKAVLSRLGQVKFPLAAPTWPDSVPRPSPERHTGLDYDHEWSRRYPVRLARAMVLDNVTRPLAKTVAPATVRGLEYLRHTEGPFIFAANHASHIDTPLLLATLPVELRHHTIVAAASDYFFDRTWKSILWTFSLAAIPIDRSKVNRRSADMAADLIEEGWNLVIFPEGGRSPDGWAQAFRGGAAYLARRTGQPVVPVYLHGTRHIMPKRASKGAKAPGGSGSEGRGGRRLRRTNITVFFGRPMTPRPGEDARKFSARIEAAVTSLADEVNSDWWTARQNEAKGSSPSLQGPDASSWRRTWALDPSPDDVHHAGEKIWPPR